MYLLFLCCAESLDLYFQCNYSRCDCTCSRVVIGQVSWCVTLNLIQIINIHIFPPVEPLSVVVHNRRPVFLGKAVQGWIQA